MNRFLFGVLMVVVCLVLAGSASAQGSVGKVYSSGHGSGGGVVRSRVTYGGSWGGYSVRRVTRFRRGLGLAGYGSAGHSYQSYGSTGNGVTVEVPVAEFAVEAPAPAAAVGCGCGCPNCTCTPTTETAYVAPRKRVLILERVIDGI